MANWMIVVSSIAVLALSIAGIAGIKAFLFAPEKIIIPQEELQPSASNTSQEIPLESVDATVRVRIQESEMLNQPSPSVADTKSRQISKTNPTTPTASPAVPPAEYPKVVSPNPQIQIPNQKLFDEFRAWAQERGIALQGIKREINDLYYNKYDPKTDNVPWESVDGALEAYRGLKILPDQILEVMRGNTVYLSSVAERPYTVLSGNYGGVLKDLANGIIVTQTITPQSVIHEFAHILGYFGIEGIYEHDFPQFKKSQPEYDRIFDTSATTYDPSSQEPPAGYISNYASANKAENFAEHFAHYVLEAPAFRGKTKQNALIAEKYEFLKEKIFVGKEY